jgi:hypothetical protein
MMLDIHRLANATRPLRILFETVVIDSVIPESVLVIEGGLRAEGSERARVVGTESELRETPRNTGANWGMALRQFALVITNI